MRVRTIRDDIHGDIRLSSLETSVIDSRIFQRLRGIRQSAGAHLVFPTMRVTRFEHSIGVMHLSSKLLNSTLLNASDATRRDLLGDLSAFVDGLREFDAEFLAEGQTARKPTDVLAVLREGHVGGSLSAAFEVPSRTSGSSIERDRWTAALAVCEQGVRLCALLHDVGHLPFSHDLELAIERIIDTSRETDPGYARTAGFHNMGHHLHEKVSLGLSSVLRDEVAAAAPHGIPEKLFWDAAFSAARQLLGAKLSFDTPATGDDRGSQSSAVARWLYTLIDGEIDADRADYVLRDSAGYTLGGATFDLSRLLNGVAVQRQVDAGTTSFATVATRAGAAAVEEYFLARFRLYKDAVYHHRIQKATAGLRYAITQVARYEDDAQLDEFFENVRRVAELGASNETSRPLAGLQPPERAEAIRASAGALCTYDDEYLKRLTLRVLERPTADLVGPNVKRAQEALSAFTTRSTPLSTLWKRANELPGTADERQQWLRSVTHRSISATTVASLEEEGVLVSFIPPKLWAPADDTHPDVSALRVSMDSEHSEPLSSHAPLFSALRSIAPELLHVYAFAFDASATTIAQALVKDAQDAGTIDEQSSTSEDHGTLTA